VTIYKKLALLSNRWQALSDNKLNGFGIKSANPPVNVLVTHHSLLHFSLLLIFAFIAFFLRIPLASLPFAISTSLGLICCFFVNHLPILFGVSLPKIDKKKQNSQKTQPISSVRVTNSAIND